MKIINLSNTDLDSIDLSLFDKYLAPKYKKTCEEAGYGFYEKSGKEQYLVGIVETSNHDGDNTLFGRGVQEQTFSITLGPEALGDGTFNINKLTFDGKGGIPSYDGKKLDDDGKLPPGVTLIKVGTLGEKDGKINLRNDCFGADCESDSKALKIAKADARKDAVGRAVAFIDFALTKFDFGGISNLIYGKDAVAKFRQKIDLAFCEKLGGVFGGVDCWSSKLCSSKVERVQQGTLIMETAGGLQQPVAHVEGERQTVTFTNASGPQREITYKLTFVVDNPSYWKYGFNNKGEDLRYQVTLVGPSSNTPLLQKNNPIRDVEPGNKKGRFGDDPFVQKSKNEYTGICITFTTQLPLGIGSSKIEANQVCNAINEITPQNVFLPERFTDETDPNFVPPPGFTGTPGSTGLTGFNTI